MLQEDHSLTKVSNLSHLQVRLSKLAIMVGDFLSMALAFACRCSSVQGW